MTSLTHFDESGATRMVQVGGKEVTERMARAEAVLSLSAETLQQILDRRMSKGDVIEVARLAGVMGCKRTAELIPLCHVLGLEGAEIQFEAIGENQLRVESMVNTHGRTGVEMEALTAVTIAALTIYDMCKSIDRGMEICGIRLLEKTGGKSGHFLREKEKANAVNVQEHVRKF